jgi:hypothetical protein
MEPKDFFQCEKCQGFMEDWFSQPLSPRDLLFNDVNRARLERIKPQIIPLFTTLIKKLTQYELQSISFNIECNKIQKSTEMLYEQEAAMNIYLQKYTWRIMTEQCLSKHPYPVSDIQEIIIENFVCKNDLHKELIGFYITALVNLIPEVHGCHINGLKMS